MFRSGQWLICLLNPLNFQLLVLRRDIWKVGGGGSVTGRRGQFVNATGVFGILFFLFLAWKPRHFVPKSFRYPIIVKENHHRLVPYNTVHLSHSCHRWKTDPNHWHIPPFLHLVSLTIFGGGPDTLTGPRSHSVKGPQHQHQKIPEPVQPASLLPYDGVLDNGPPSPITEAMVVPAHEDVASGETGNSDAGKRWLHPGDKPALLWNGDNKGHK